MKNPRRSKIKYIILSVLTALAFVGCGDNDIDTSEVPALNEYIETRSHLNMTTTEAMTTDWNLSVVIQTGYDQSRIIQNNQHTTGIEECYNAGLQAIQTWADWQEYKYIIECTNGWNDNLNYRGYIADNKIIKEKNNGGDEVPTAIVMTLNTEEYYLEWGYSGFILSENLYKEGVYKNVAEALTAAEAFMVMEKDAAIKEFIFKPSKELQPSKLPGQWR